MKGWKKGERDAAKLLAEWWGVKFYRSPASGAMATVMADALSPNLQRAMTGDIYCDDEEFPFSVEVKAYAQLSLYSLMTNPKADLWAHWEQAKVQAMRFKQIPMLMFKEDRKSFFIAFPRYFLEELFKVLTGKTASAKIEQIYYIDDHSPLWSMSLQKADMVVMSWKAFSEGCFKSDVVEAALACHEKRYVLGKPDPAEAQEESDSLD